MKYIPIVLAFIAGLFIDFIKKVILNTIEEEREKHIFNSLIFGFSGYTKHSHLYNVGPLITNCVVWKGIDKRNQSGWKYGDITFSYVEDSKVYKDNLQSFIEQNWKEQIKENPKLENQNRCGLRRIDFEQGVYITFYPTNYKRFIGTNRSVTNNKFSTYITETERKLARSKNGYKYLSESILSNDLATATTVITKDGYILLAKRSQEVFVLKNLIHTSIAEGMHLDLDWHEELGAPDPFKTIVRGAKEELNLDVDPSEVEITSFGLYRPFMQPFVTAKIKVDYTYDEILELMADHDNTFEGNVFAVEYNLTNLSPFLFDRQFLGQDLKMAELGKVSILQCLIQKHGRGRLHRGLINTYKVVERYF